MASEMSSSSRFYVLEDGMFGPYDTKSEGSSLSIAERPPGAASATRYSR